MSGKKKVQSSGKEKVQSVRNDSFDPQGGKGRSKWIFESEDGKGYFSYYVKDHYLKKDGTHLVYLRCICKSTCKAHGNYNMTTDTFTLSKDQVHTHDPDPNAKPNAVTNQKIYTLARLMEMSKPKEIFKPLRVLSQQTGRQLTIIAARKKIHNARKTLYNLKLKGLPQKVYVEKFCEYFTTGDHADELKYQFHDKFYALKVVPIETLSYNKKVKKHEKKFHAVLYDEQYMRSVVPKIKNIFTDATYDGLPPFLDAYQLLTVCGEIKNEKNPNVKTKIVLFWAVMANKEQNSYHAVFAHIKVTFEDFKPLYSMSDFETAIRNVLIELFPWIIITLCFFHYSQATTGKGKKLKLFANKDKAEDEPEIFIVLRRVVALALLPPKFIKPTLEQIIEEATAAHGSLFAEYFKYINYYWMKIVGPDRFSVHDLLEHRTNNYVESNNKQLNDDLEKSPHLKSFLRYLMFQMKNMRTDVDAVASGYFQAREVGKDTKENQKNIEELWEKIRELLDDAEGEEPFSLLELIDEMPKIKILKDIERENFIKAFNNVKEIDAGLINLDQLGDMPIIEWDGKNDDYLHDQLMEMKHNRGEDGIFFELITKPSA